MTDVVREDDVRQVVRVGRAQFWDAVRVSLHQWEQEAVALDVEVGERSPMVVFADWCDRVTASLTDRGPQAVAAERERLDSPAPPEPPEA